MDISELFLLDLWSFYTVSGIIYNESPRYIRAVCLSEQLNFKPFFYQLDRPS